MGAPAKVVHIITRLDFGGAQQNTLETVRTLNRSRFTPLLVFGPGGPLESELASLEARCLPLASLLRPLSPATDLLCLLELTSLLLRERPAIVHTHSSKAGILGRIAARLAGVPVVVHTFHGFGFHSRQGPLTRTAYVLAERLCATLSDSLIFVSQANREEALRFGIGEERRYELIRSGVDLAAFPAAVADPARKKASFGLGMHKPLVTSIGNLKPQKNPADFLLMAQAVLRSQPEARFLFIGDGPLRERMEGRMIALGLHGKLALPGWRRDAAEALAVSDVFVMTSLWEGLPRALVEAMKSGLPSVCYATDGVKDVVRDGENGFLVEQGDVPALAGRVAQLLGDEGLRKRLGAAAAASIGPEFDIGGMVRSQEELYGRLLRAAGD
jgi:glycosyltransferase involved in cell wall biosynthesis